MFYSFRDSRNKNIIPSLLVFHFYYFLSLFTSFILWFLFSWLLFCLSVPLIQFLFESIFLWALCDLFFISELILFLFFHFFPEFNQLLFITSLYLGLFLFIVFEFLIQVAFSYPWRLSWAYLIIFGMLFFFIFFCFLVILQEGGFYSVNLCDILFPDILQ